ncbi:MAG: hypothetical protein ACE5F6_17895 [Anaerolineae bacterium]
MAMQTAWRLTATEPDEHEMVDHLAGYFGAYPREVVVNYYAILKTKPFVILTGPCEVDKMELARGFAEALVGSDSLQCCSFQAHPWWVTHTGDAGYFAAAHTQFTTLKLLDFIEAAAAGEAAGLAFFVDIERMSPAEVVCYFGDLPRGRLWRPGASTARIRLPSNLYVTGTLDVEQESRLVLSQDVYRHAAIIRVEHAHCAPQAEPRGMSRWRPDWQQCFINTAIRHHKRAREKLARILPKGHAPMAPVAELAHRLRASGLALAPLVCEEAWLYLANAFDHEGRGLFVEPAIENLRIAQEYMLVQSVLPRVRSQTTEARIWAEVADYLAPRFSRAHARAEHLSRNGAGG